MRRLTPATLAVVSCLLVAAAFAADDLFTTAASDPKAWENSMVNVARGSFAPPQITDALRALPGEQRAAWVTSLGAWARTYTASEDFQKRYKKAYKDWKKSQGGGGGGFGLGALKKKAEDAAAKAAEEKVTGKKDDRWTMDEDPNATIKRRLTFFLETTKDVDFGAKLAGRQFANEDYESKPSEWKMCYRAGREATTAAREVATAWLADLEKAAPAK
jgi:hypothetical protein